MGQELGRDPGAEAAVRAAFAEAHTRRQEYVDPVHLLSGILDQHGEPGIAILTQAGISEAVVRERVLGWLG